MLLAEFVGAPEHGAEKVRGILRRGARVDPVPVREEQAEALFGERKEDVVLAREVAVDGGRAVLDAIGDLANRDFLVAVRDEELAGCIEDRPCDRLAVPFVSFFDAQVLYFPAVIYRVVWPR